VVERAVDTPRPVRHRVTRGDTLYSLASRYDTSIRAIQQANRMGRRTSIRIGETLTIPTRAQELEE
jgi:N-acetylmuramoyl-L-alanine amidase